MRAIDFQLFAKWLVPPILRGRRIMAVVRAMIAPTVHLYEKYQNHASFAEFSVKITPQKLAMYQRMVALGVKYTRVSIVNAEFNERAREFLYFEAEQQPIYIKREKENDSKPWYVRMPNESTFGANFIIKIPTDLKLSEVPGNVQTIADRYKAAGRTYRIQYI
ncbi:MAG: hypothetical protein IKB97_02375 [Bacteroidaceae bacterium]|nr:hypothetical protein [Bacteroidaceae bacterium]